MLSGALAASPSPATALATVAALAALAPTTALTALAPTTALTATGATTPAANATGLRLRATHGGCILVALLLGFVHSRAVGSDR